MTPPPDLLPWNATGCCAGNKKRQRLKPQGATLPGPGESSAAAARRRKNMFSGFPFAHGRGVWGDFTYYDPPLPPSVHTSTGPCPDAHLFHSRSGYRVFPRIPGPLPVLRGGSLCYLRLFLSSSLVPHATARDRKLAKSTFHIILGELWCGSLLVLRGRRMSGRSTVFPQNLRVPLFSSQVN